MMQPQSDRDRENMLEEYRDAIREARNALDVMEKEIEEELGPESPSIEN